MEPAKRWFADRSPRCTHGCCSQTPSGMTDASSGINQLLGLAGNSSSLLRNFTILRGVEKRCGKVPWHSSGFWCGSCLDSSRGTSQVKDSFCHLGRFYLGFLVAVRGCSQHPDSFQQRKGAYGIYYSKEMREMGSVPTNCRKSRALEDIFCLTNVCILQPIIGTVGRSNQPEAALWISFFHFACNFRKQK